MQTREQRLLQKRVYYLAHKEEFLERNRASKAKNPVAHAEYQRRYRQENKKKLAEYNEANRHRWVAGVAKARENWRRANRQRELDVGTQYRLANKEKCTKMQTNWRLKNAGVCKERVRRRQLLIKAATPQWADLDQMRLVYEKATELSSRHGISYHVDHVVPLTHTLVCGLHSQDNLQVLQATENISKGNRHWPDMP